MSEQEGELGTDDYEIEGRMENSSIRDNAENRCFNSKGTGLFTRQCKAPRRQHRSQLHLN